jgi:hypothetical protein
MHSTNYQRLPAAVTLLTLTISMTPSLSASPISPIELFVSPNSTVSGDGSHESPFPTLEAARDAARTARSKTDAPIFVNLLGGTHRRTTTFQLDARDSGRPDAPTTYRSAPGEKATISGGEAVTGWTPAEDGTFEAQVGPALFRQVYLDGQLLQQARFPNGGWHGPFLRLVGADVEKHLLHVRTEDWEEAKKLAGDAPIEIAWNGHWTHFRAKIGPAETGPEYVALAVDSPDEASFFVKPVSYFTNFPYHFEGAPGFLDAAGEWHHDPATGKLRVKFPPGVDPNAHLVEIPRLGVLLEIAGTESDPVRHVEFNDLTFETSNWTRPSTRGFPATQFAQPYGGPQSYEGEDYPPGLIRLRHTDHVGLRHNRIRNAGATGIQIWGNANHTDIEGNEIGPVMANGIEVDAATKTTTFMKTEGPGDPQSLDRYRSKSIAIWNNRIRECGRQYVNGGAILAHFVEGLIIDRNEISDLPYSAIQVGNQPGGYNDWGCHNNLIRWNRIHRVMQLLDDGGGIYTLGGQQHGTRIEENYISDLVRSPWTANVWLAGIYLDKYTQFVTVRRNAIINAPTFIATINGAKDNRLIENEGMIEREPDPTPDGGIPRWGTLRVLAARPMTLIKEVMENAGPREGHDPRKGFTDGDTKTGHPEDHPPPPTP